MPDPADFQDLISHIRLLNRDTEAFIDASAEDIFCRKVRDKKNYAENTSVCSSWCGSIESFSIHIVNVVLIVALILSVVHLRKYASCFYKLHTHFSHCYPIISCEH